MDGTTSQWYKQETGIRQGCPLSPYLFLVIMTTLFHDIHEGDTQNLSKHRIQGTTYDEILYADDTICASTDVRAMNKFIKSIEIDGERYGLKLNKKKCESMHTGNNNVNIHFMDGTQVKRKQEVTYLGCELNMEGDMKR